jgi:hypothetical protein
MDRTEGIGEAIAGVIILFIIPILIFLISIILIKLSKHEKDISNKINYYLVISLLNFLVFITIVLIYFIPLSFLFIFIGLFYFVKYIILLKKREEIIKQMK